MGDHYQRTDSSFSNQYRFGEIVIQATKSCCAQITFLQLFVRQIHILDRNLFKSIKIMIMYYICRCKNTNKMQSFVITQQLLWFSALLQSRGFICVRSIDWVFQIFQRGKFMKLEQVSTFVKTVIATRFNPKLGTGSHIWPADSMHVGHLWFAWFYHSDTDASWSTEWCFPTKSFCVTHDLSVI